MLLFVLFIVLAIKANLSESRVLLQNCVFISRFMNRVTTVKVMYLFSVLKFLYLIFAGNAIVAMTML